MAEIKGLLFDKDGTLFDFFATWRGVIKDACMEIAQGDIDLARKLGEVGGFDIDTGEFKPGAPVVAETTGFIAETWAPLATHLSVTEIEDDLNRRAVECPLDQLVTAAPDLVGLLQRFKDAGIKLGVGTHDSEAAAKGQLSTVGALGMFDFIAGYDSGKGHKPGPGMMLAFCEETGLTPDQCAMVGDSIHDLECGKNAGSLRIGVLTGPASRADLEADADIVLNSIAEIPEYLKL